jgi:alkyl sulfatase BDS1-like metallo-beta-lactamase superfamily hydrolase
LGHTYRTELSNGVLVQQVDPHRGTAGLRVTLDKRQLLSLLGGGGLADLPTEGDVSLVGKLVSYLDDPVPDFAIVTP